MSHSHKTVPLSLSQAPYIENFAPKFLSKDELRRGSSLPALVKTKDGRTSTFTDLRRASTEEERVTDFNYLSALASALYACCMTRGDAQFHVSFLARFTAGPTKECVSAVKMLIAYLYQTRYLSLTYGKEWTIPSCPSARPELNTPKQMKGLVVYSDASWKTDCTYAGFFILMGGAAVDWASVLLRVMLSSTEAEITAGSLAGKRLVYIRSLATHLGLDLPSVAVSHVIDNSASTYLTTNMGVAKKTEHFLRAQHYLRFLVTHGFVRLHLCRTHDQLADALTKVLPKDEFLTFRSALGLKSPHKDMGLILAP